MQIKVPKDFSRKHTSFLNIGNVGTARQWNRFVLMLSYIPAAGSADIIENIPTVTVLHKTNLIKPLSKSVNLGAQVGQWTLQ
jgi:hypothetical protein